MATIASEAETLQDPRTLAGSEFRCGSRFPARPAAERLNHIRLLEAESIHILREVASEFQRPVMLYSIGKDSSVMLRLAQKAFYPGADSVSAAARRYRLQVPRDARISRSIHERAGAEADRVAQ